jgi:hypothetical protein
MAQLEWGVKGGLSIANTSLEGDEDDDLSSRTGFAAGAYFNYPLTARFGIQPEVLYVQKGARLSEDGFEFKLNLDYIEIPILFVAKFAEAGRGVRPFVGVGPSIGFNTTAKEIEEFEGVTDEDDIEEISSTDFGLVFTGGVQFNRFGVEVRYNLGLMDVEGEDDDFTAKTRSFMILFSYAIGQR